MVFYGQKTLQKSSTDKRSPMVVYDPLMVFFKYSIKYYYFLIVVVTKLVIIDTFAFDRRILQQKNKQLKTG